jgi:hypothetical protein
MSESEQDKHLSALYRQASREEPPMALDSVVLTRARNALPEQRTLFQKVKWMVPVASAAVALLTVSLIVQLKQEQVGGIVEQEEALSLPVDHIRSKPEQLSKPQLENVVQGELTQPAKRSGAATAGQQSVPEHEPAAPVSSEHRMAPAASMMRESRQLQGMSGEPGAAIARIRSMLAEGEREQAITAITQFRRDFPDYPLPEDLQQLK